MKKWHSSSSSKNQNEKHKTSMAGFASMTEDLVQNILGRLPAPSFASAACVSKSWNQICNRILSRPKFASAISLNPSPHISVKEVLDKVLSEPIRPHFAIASVFSGGLSLENTLPLLAEKLGSNTPIILSCANGIMGRDAQTDEFKEIMTGDAFSDGDDEVQVDTNSGIMLIVGFVPGLRVDALPMALPKEAEPGAVDCFVRDIRNYAASVSGCTSPLGIVMFGLGGLDQQPVIEKLDYAMSVKTIIVGDERSTYLYRSGIWSRNNCRVRRSLSGSVALVFARDRDHPCGIGEIQFDALLSKGMSTIGPRYKAVSVRKDKSNHFTFLNAKREGEQGILDGQMILDDINDELENQIGYPDLYVGVTKQRKCSIGSEKSKRMAYMTFHGVVEGSDHALIVNGVGIRTGDYFQFYISDPNTALSSCSDVSLNLRSLKQDSGSKNCLNLGSAASNLHKKELIGGLVFSCCGRGESFFGHRNVDSSPFLENFPGVPLAGIFCGGEIARGYSDLNAPEGQEQSAAHCCLHVYSTVYLVVSYTPAPPQP